MGQERSSAERVETRKVKLERAFAGSTRVAISKTSRGNVYLFLGKYATQRDLDARLAHAAHFLKSF